MIKSQIELPKSNKHTFPLLARLTKAKKNGGAAGTVVLFNNSLEGVVVVSSESYDVGHFSTWISCHDEEVWEILPPGSFITLTVE